MSVDFVKSGKNSNQIATATRQEEQLSYLTQSKIQDTNLTSEYLAQWANRQFETNDFFLNYVKSIFKVENFIAFSKYLRFPLPSAKLINNKIKPNLARVFHAEDSYCNYSVSGVEQNSFISEMDVDGFNKNIFNAFLFNHNSIIVTDLKDINKPFRVIKNIKDIVSIDLDEDNTIEKIAFKACIEVEDEKINGYVYIDDESYIFVDSNDKELINSPHDLGYCPAHFICNEIFKDEPVVRSSIFSYIREELEEYNFLKTLQKMTEPNGAIPITIKLEAGIDGKDDIKGDRDEPNAENVMGSQRAGIYKQTSGNSSGLLQAGSVIEVPQLRTDNGSLDMDAVQNFLKFIYIPIEALEYLSKRIQSIEDSIVTAIIGDVVSSNEDAKNQTQIEKSVSVLEDNLRYLSNSFSRIRKLSDTDFLGLKYGISRVKEVSIFYGSDFFLDSESMLYDLFVKAPNPIERKNTLIRLTQNRYQHNHEQMNRQKLLYQLMPFCADKDFELGKDKIDDVTYQYQVRFNYWISAFEAEYGDLLTFFNSMPEASDAQKYLVINNLIKNLINKNTVVEKVEDSSAVGGGDVELGKIPLAIQQLSLAMFRAKQSGNETQAKDLEKKIKELTNLI